MCTGLWIGPHGAGERRVERAADGELGVESARLDRWSEGEDGFLVPLGGRRVPEGGREKRRKGQEA